MWGARVWRPGLCGERRRAMERGSFRVWFIIESCVYISSVASTAQRTLHRLMEEENLEIGAIKKGFFKGNWVAGAETETVTELGGLHLPLLWKRGEEMLNHMWQLRNWPRFNTRIAGRRGRGARRGTLMSNHYSRSTLCNNISRIAMWWNCWVERF